MENNVTETARRITGAQRALDELKDIGRRRIEWDYDLEMFEAELDKMQIALWRAARIMKKVKREHDNGK